MELDRKLAILADAAKYDASCASSGTREARLARRHGASARPRASGICHSYAPDGRCISLLKILLTNFCIYDCHYCVNRVSQQRRARPLHRRRGRRSSRSTSTAATTSRACSSAPASSASPDYTMEQVVEVARVLREDHDFRGYIHLKTIPDADAGAARAAPAATPTGSASTSSCRPTQAWPRWRRRRTAPRSGARWRDCARIDDASEARGRAPTRNRAPQRARRRASRPPARARR